MSTQTPPLSSKIQPSHSPSQIASSPKVRDVKISPNGALILYQVQPFYKASDRSVSELWIAETDVAESARQLTSGLYNDRAGVFHPDGQRILFLSDKHSPGKAGYIYSLELRDKGESESIAVSASFGRKGVQAFEVSPDGNFIAFTSSDEATEEEERRLKEKADANVFGGKRGLSRLRLYDFRTGNISTLEGIRKDLHVESFTWSPESDELLYRLRQNRGSEYEEREIILEKISVTDSLGPMCIGSYSRSPSGKNIWVSSGHVVDLQSYEPRNILDARTFFAHAGNVLDNDRAAKLYGVTEDAVRVVNMRSKSEDLLSEGMVAVEVCSGVSTHIDVVSLADEGKGGVKTLFRLFETHDDAIWFGAWDAKRVVNNNGDVSYVFAAVLSSGVRHEPPNVWAGRVSGAQGTVSRKIKLSSHLQWLADAPKIRTEVISWNVEDGTKLDGLVRYPPGYDESWGPLPTVLFIHGGPYRRDIPDYMPYFCNWRELFASAGYLVVSPNYRGSQGRGHEFAHDATLGIGIHDWPDCESMVDEVIRRRLADPDRLAVAGWSHGGSLTAWGVTKRKNRFKAAIVGAGVSNWEGMVMESGSPELEAAIGQSTPWSHDDPEKSMRKTSPIHSVAGVTTAVLILHGENDERVPVGQAIGLWRGLKRKAAESGREGAQLIVYPREPHGFVERKHAEDVLNKVLVHLDTWI